MNVVARTPPMLRLEDLDREELLQLIIERSRSFPLQMFRPSDLLNARYDVADRRAQAAQKRRMEASEEYFPLLEPVDPQTMSTKAYRALQARREAARLAHDTADRALKRAEAARERAWKALNALWEQSR